MPDVSQIIIIETTELNSILGSVKVFERCEMDAILNQGKITCAHKTELNYTLNSTRSEGYLPNHRALVGMQSDNMDQGDALSER